MVSWNYKEQTIEFLRLLRLNGVSNDVVNDSFGCVRNFEQKEAWPKQNLSGFNDSGFEDVTSTDKKSNLFCACSIKDHIFSLKFILTFVIYDQGNLGYFCFSFSIRSVYEFRKICSPWRFCRLIFLDFGFAFSANSLYWLLFYTENFFHCLLLMTHYYLFENHGKKNNILFLWQES